MARGKLEEAEVELRAALASWEKRLGSEHPKVARAQCSLASLLLERGRPDEALPLAEQAWRQHQREDVPLEHRAEAAFMLAQILWSIRGPQRDRARAIALAEDAARSLAADEGEHAQALEVVERWRRSHRAR